MLFIKDLIFSREDFDLYSLSTNIISEKRIKRICWIFDKKITYQVLISFCSIIKNNPYESFVFYFILPPNTIIDLTAFNHFLKPWMVIEIRHFSMNHNISSIVDFHQQKCPHSSIIIVKIWLPEILPDVNQVLYLDSDMINNGPVSEIWKYDSNGKTIFATTRVNIWWINSGFIFYNLEEIRKRNNLIRCGTRINSCFIDDLYHTRCHRQSIEILPYRYNVELKFMISKDSNETRQYRLNEENNTIFFHLKDKTSHNFFTGQRFQLKKIVYAKRSNRVLGFLNNIFNIRDWVDSELWKINLSRHFLV